MSKNIPALQVEGMIKSFGDHEVLKGIDLTAHTGDVISIIGSSGSGKSTFLRCINLLETPNAGKVHVHGELIRMKTLKDGSQEAADKKQPLWQYVLVMFWAHQAQLSHFSENR